MVTAELMTVAPLAVAFVFMLLWIVSLGLTQVRVADAARESARMLARGESIAAARTAAGQFSPKGATIHVATADGAVSVTIRARSRMPLPFFSGIGSRTMESTSVAMREEP